MIYIIYNVHAYSRMCVCICMHTYTCVHKEGFFILSKLINTEQINISSKFTNKIQYRIGNRMNILVKSCLAFVCFCAFVKRGISIRNTLRLLLFFFLLNLTFERFAAYFNDKGLARTGRSSYELQNSFIPVPLASRSPLA